MDMKSIGQSATWLSVVNQLFATRTSKLLEPSGLTLGQFSSLHHIAQPHLAGKTRISDIAKAVEVGQPAVTKAVAKFEKLGLIRLQSDENDLRVKHVLVTTKGRDLLEEIRRSMGPDFARVFGRYTPEQLEGFNAMLADLCKWLDQNRL